MTTEQTIKNLEENFQSSYHRNTRLAVAYVDEKLQRALESLVVSKGNLRERIWHAYKYYFSDFLWSFDYKKYLSKVGQNYWAFLQKELRYRIGSEIKDHVQYMLKHNSKEAVLKYLEYDRFGNCPNFIRNMRKKDLEIARAMFNIIDEIHDINCVKKNC